MSLARFRGDQRGASAVEFAVTAPVYFLILFAIIEAGLLLWTQLGLQHGAQSAARCAAIDTTTCNTSSAIQAYAAQKSFALNPPSSIFVVQTLGCGVNVSADYTYNFLSNFFKLPTLSLHAKACFPK
jgi:Flp pilus assembly protein TadG